MSVKIDDFKAVFDVAGFARSNRYQVEFPDAGRDLSVICDSLTWPGRQIFTEEVYTNMKARKVAYTFGQEDITMTFVLGNDWYAWDYLYEWQQKVIGNIGSDRGFVINYKEDYARNNIVIRHLDTKNDIRKSAKLKNVYPTTLDSIELGNANENEVIRVSATFAYDNWELIKE